MSTTATPHNNTITSRTSTTVAPQKKAVDAKDGIAFATVVIGGIAETFLLRGSTKQAAATKTSANANSAQTSGNTAKQVSVANTTNAQTQTMPYNSGQSFTVDGLNVWIWTEPYDGYHEATLDLTIPGTPGFNPTLSQGQAMTIPLSDNRVLSVWVLKQDASDVTVKVSMAGATAAASQQQQTGSSSVASVGATQPTTTHGSIVLPIVLGVAVLATAIALEIPRIKKWFSGHGEKAGTDNANTTS